MMKVRSNILLLIFLTLLSVIVCFIPLMNHQYFVFPEPPKETYAKDPSSYKYSLISGITASVLFLSDYIGDSMIIPCRYYDRKGVLSNLLLLISMLSFETLSFCLDLPFQNYALSNILGNLKYVIIALSGFSYLNENDESFSKLCQAIMSTALIVFGLIINCFNFVPNLALSITIIVLEVLGCSTLFWFSFQYLKSIYKVKQQNTKNLSNEEYSCIVHLLMLNLLALAEIISYLAHGFPQSSIDYSSSFLIANNYIYIVCISMSILLQTRISRRESLAYKLELEAKRTFVNYISHEIRTPLNTIKVGLQLAREEVGQLPMNRNAAGLLENVKDMQSSCAVALDTVNDFLLLDKIDQGILLLDRVVVNAADLIEEAVNPFSVQARISGVRLRIVYDVQDGMNPDVDLMVEVDPHKLSQVIRNLVSNGLKFTPREGIVKVRVSRCRKPLLAVKDWVRVDVSDSGIGLSQPNQDRLFKEIVQFSPGKLQGGGGSGFGLFMSYGLVQMHGGSLTVHSDGEGLGCTFSLEIPITKSTAGAPPAPSTIRISDAWIRRISPDTGAPIEVRRVPPVAEREEVKCSSASKAYGRSENSPHSLREGRSGRRDVGEKEEKGREEEDEREEADEEFGRAGQAMDRGEGGGRSEEQSISSDVERESLEFNTSSSGLLGSARGHLSSSHLSSGSIVIGTGSGSGRLGRGGAVIEVDEGDVPVYMSRATDNGDAAEVATSSRHRSVLHLSSQRNSSRSITSNFRACTFNAQMEQMERDSNASPRSAALPTVLVVDDTSLSRKMHRRLLLSRGRLSDEAANGFEAVEKVKESLETSRATGAAGGSCCYNLVMLDYQMPVMNGPEAAKELRRLGYTGVIAGVTGNVSQQDTDVFIRHGATVVLKKPLDIDEFDRLLARLPMSTTSGRTPPLVI